MRIDLLQVLCFMFFIVADGVAQDSVPDFEMKFYFEDAIGNRDSVVVGYDDDASGEHLNPEFSEIPLLTPFDSVFEVRGTHIWGEHSLKRVIGNGEYGPFSGCYAATGVWIFFHVPNLPITITYDSVTLNSTWCHTDAILSPTWTIYTYPEWRFAEKLYCLSTTNQIVDDFEDDFEDPLLREFEVEGKGMQQLQGYFFEIFWPSGYCQSLVSYIFR